MSKVGLWSDFWQDIIDTAVDQWRKHLQACVRTNVGHFEHLLWKKLANNLQFFMSFWFKWLLSIMSDFYCVDAWWSVGLPCLTSKVKLVKNSEWTKIKMLIFWIVLIFALIFMIFYKYLSYRWYKLTFETFYVYEKCKISDFKFSKVMQQHT